MEAIITLIIEYFNGMSLTNSFRNILCYKETSKAKVANWILCAVGSRGYAVNLKEFAKKHNVWLCKDSNIQAGDKVYVSISGASHGLTNTALNLLKDQCTRIIEMGCYVIADNKQNAMRNHNLLSEGELYKYLTSKGYYVRENDAYAIWSKEDPSTKKPLVYQGTGSSWEYVAEQTEFLRKHASRKSIVRATKDKVKFMNFSSLDIEKLKSILGPRIIESHLDYAYYKPNEKYTKTKENLQRIIMFLREKGMVI